MKLIVIDEDELEPDSEWSEYADGYIAYSSIQIQAAKVADAIPVIHGDMEQLEKITIKVPHCRCSACNKLVVGWKSEINFCPNCGARMDGVE